MRLSQLARKLEISPSELLEFFKKNNIDHYTSPNNRIREEDEVFALQNYKIKVVQAKENAVNKRKQDILSAADALEDDGSKPADLDNEMIPDIKENQKDDQGNDVNEVEYIRMPKVKLEGVKVVGKIDLPESSKKATEEKETDQISTVKEEEVLKPKIKKHPDKGYKRSNYKSKTAQKRKNHELSYKEKLRREEKKRNIEQEKLKKLRKQKKKLHYIRNVQSNVQTVMKKKKSKAIAEVELKPVAVKPVYKNPLRRIWAWLNGEFDEH
jgi:hypothetical protein